MWFGETESRASIFKRLHKNELEIKTAKYNKLQTLLEYIPPIYHNFYKNLKHSDSIVSRVSKNPGENDDEENKCMLLDSDYDV